MASRRRVIDRRVHDHNTSNEQRTSSPPSGPSIACTTPSQEDAETPDTQESTWPRVRGVARGEALNRLRPGETFFVDMVEGHAIGINSALFQSQLGILARSTIPITIRDFRRDVTQEMRALLLKRLRESFSWDDSEEMNRMILSHAAELHRTWRFRIKRDYFDENLPINQVLANVPKETTEQEWKTLVDYWTSKDYKEMQLKNTASRGYFDEVAHRMGRKSLRQLGHELEGMGIEPNRCNLFLHSKTRKGEGGKRVWHDDELQKQHKLMEELQHPPDGSCGISADLAYIQATGPEHPGRVRGVGAGVKPSRYYGHRCQSDRNVDDRLKKVEEMLAHLVKAVDAMNRGREASSSRTSRSSQRECASSGRSRGLSGRRAGEEDSDYEDADADVADFALDE